MCLCTTGGSLQPNQTTNVLLQYDASLLPGQGRYDSDILVTMSEQPYAKARCCHVHVSDAGLLEGVLEAVAVSSCRLDFDGRYHSLQAYAATFLFFCAQLSAVRESGLQHTVQASFSSIQDVLPPALGSKVPDWTVAAAAGCETCIFAEVAVRCWCW